MIIRGKDVLRRSEILSQLLCMNRDADGPWEPAIFLQHVVGSAHRRAYVGHDDLATLDIHLPGDGIAFEPSPVIAKLQIAPVICRYCGLGRK